MGAASPILSAKTAFKTIEGEQSATDKAGGRKKMETEILKNVKEFHRKQS